MRQEIPTWAVVVVIVVIIAIAAIVLWRGTSVQKRQESPEELPGAMMQKYGAPGPMVPRPGQPTQPAPNPPARR